jgi:hypothetical protein
MNIEEQMGYKYTFYNDYSVFLVVFSVQLSVTQNKNCH